MPFDKALVDTENGPARLADVDLIGPYNHSTNVEDPGEYVVSVDWSVVVGRTEAHSDPLLFSNSATTVEMRADVPRHVHTIEVVNQRLRR